MAERFGARTEADRKQMVDELVAEKDHEKRREAGRRLRLTEHYSEVRRRLEGERAIQAFVESYLREHSPVDSGNNGVIYRLDMEEASPEIREAFERCGISLGEDGLAAKLIKVYQPGKAEEEWRLQSQAYELCADLPGPAARVPAAIGPIEVDLGDDAPGVTTQQGLTVGGGKKEVIVMDYIEGKDLSRIMFEFVLKGHGLEDEIELRSDFNMLHYKVEALLGYSQPGGKSRNEGERNHEKKKVERENLQKLYSYLREHGFKISPTVADKLERAIAKMHKAALYHNDTHERNIMISGDPASDEAEVFVIDFGAATTGTRDEERPDDSDVVRRLRNDLHSKDDVATRKRNEMLSELQSTTDRLLGMPKGKVLYDKLDTILRDQPERLATMLLLAETAPAQLDSILGFMLHMAKSGDAALAPEELQRLLRSYVAERGKKMVIPARNRMSEVASALTE